MEETNHGKRVQNNQNSHVNNIIVTRVTVIRLKRYEENGKNNVGDIEG